MTENPYESPQATASAAIKFRMTSFKPLKVVGSALAILGLIHCIVGSVLMAICAYLYVVVVNSLHYYSQNEDCIVLAILFFVNAISILRGLLLLFAGHSLRNGRRYRWAMTGAILAACGILFPLWWLDVPFGIGAFILLRKEKHKSLFEIGPNPKSVMMPTATIAEPN